MLDANVVEEYPLVVALDNHLYLVVAQHSFDMPSPVFVVQELVAYKLRGACFVFVVACGFVAGGVAG